MGMYALLISVLQTIMARYRFGAYKMHEHCKCHVYGC